MEEIIEQYKDMITVIAGVVGIGGIFIESLGVTRQAVWEFLLSIMFQ